MLLEKLLHQIRACRNPETYDYAYTSDDIKRLMEESAEHIERLQEALQQCVEWANAYPVDIFPQPTPEQVDAVCKTLGFRIDSISAMVLRNYTSRIGEIARGALSR